MLATSAVNGVQHANGSSAKVGLSTDTVLVRGLENEPSIEELESQLPVVLDGQVPLGELISRMVQTIYAELTEMAETLPGMPDAVRKRTMADWVVKTKKQVVKLYAVVKWARDAGDVQKAMNITAFLMAQNQQFQNAIHGLTYAKESLAPARLRNHDLLTSLDVLTTGSYLRLPSIIKKHFISEPPLTNAEVAKTLKDMEDTIRFRLRISEIIPVEMSQYQIYDGRVHFNVPKLFRTSITLRGAKKEDGWLFINVDFLHNVGGDPTGMQEFPREPTGAVKLHIASEADGRLAYYLPLPDNIPPPPPGVEIPPRPQLPPGVVDAPLIRLFNFLQMMSFSYQLEILFFQSQRLRSLGWADHLRVEKSPDGKSFMASYWTRPNLNSNARQQNSLNRPNIPYLGGTVTISIVERRASVQAGGGPARSPKDRYLTELHRRSKIGLEKPSEELESVQFEVKWEPMKGAMGVVLPPEFEALAEGELQVDSENLDFESLLLIAIKKHIRGILSVFQHSLRSGPSQTMFSLPGEIDLVSDHDSLSMRVHLCADEYVLVFIDPRSGRLTMRDTGELAAAGRGPRDAMVSERLNENPTRIYDALIRLRYNTITDLAEQKAIYLGLQTFRTRNFSKEEAAKWGPAVRGHLFIQLANFPTHYLVLVITDEEFRFALISVAPVPNSPQGNLIMEDIGWLDVRRIHQGQIVISEKQSPLDLVMEQKDGMLADFTVLGRLPDRFKLESDVLRELYAYCCARVAYTKVEMQLKLHQIPHTYVNPGADLTLPSSMAHMQSSLTISLPTLCVQSSDILHGAPAAEAAMPNIRLFPLNWWSTKQTQVVTCVKLKYVQQPVGSRAGAAGTVIRPSKRIIYDSRDAVVSFLSEDIDKCVDEFLDEWAKVSKMVVIAREVAQMSKIPSWDDVRLLSFDLQTVEFAYARDYCLSITCKDQLTSSSSTYEIRFSRSTNGDKLPEPRNPHEDATPLFQNVLQHGRLRTSLLDLVLLLRITLPVVLELDEVRKTAIGNKENIEIFAKAAGWYRLLYGDFRHALDFRLLRGNRIAILDASYNFSPSSFRQQQQQVKTEQTPNPTNQPTPAAGQTSANQGTLKIPESLAILRTIPNFHQTVLQVIKHALSNGAAGPMADTEVGMVCTAHQVTHVVQHLYAEVLRQLKGPHTNGS